MSARRSRRATLALDLARATAARPRCATRPALRPTAARSAPLRAMALPSGAGLARVSLARTLRAGPPAALIQSCGGSACSRARCPPARARTVKASGSAACAFLISRNAMSSAMAVAIRGDAGGQAGAGRTLAARVEWRAAEPSGRRPAAHRLTVCLFKLC